MIWVNSFRARAHRKSSCVFKDIVAYLYLQLYLQVIWLSDSRAFS